MRLPVDDTTSIRVRADDTDTMPGRSKPIDANHPVAASGFALREKSMNAVRDKTGLISGVQDTLEIFSRRTSIPLLVGIPEP